MQLVRPILAALLALSLAIFPISGMGSAVLASHAHHHHGAATAHTHDHATVADHDGADELASAADDCAGHEASHGKETGCCGMGACHAFTVAALVGFTYSALPMGSIANRGDEQVRGELSARIERPPRTV